MTHSGRNRMCLLSTSHIPIVGKPTALYELSGGVGSVTGEEKVIPRLNPPRESHEDRTGEGRSNKIVRTEGEHTSLAQRCRVVKNTYE